MPQLSQTTVTQVVIPLQTRGFYNLQRASLWAQLNVVITPPNERLLQQVTACSVPVNWKLSYPSKREASTTLESIRITVCLKVVIPLQTRGFYNANRMSARQLVIKLSYPSKREASTTMDGSGSMFVGNVVIPLQTRGFYNSDEGFSALVDTVVIPLQTRGFYNSLFSNLLSLLSLIWL